MIFHGLLTRKKIIVFVGNDGSGKSYQAKCLMRQLEKNGLLVRLVHLDYLLLRVPPALHSNHYFSAPGNIDQSIGLLTILKGNKLFSSIFPVVVYLDFILFYIAKVFFSSQDIIIFDRYFHDKLVRFYDMGICNGTLYSFLLRIIPRPSLLFYFDVTSWVSLKRKQELTKEILARRRTLYRKIADTCHFITIDASREKDIVFKDILEKYNDI